MKFMQTIITLMFIAIGIVSLAGVIHYEINRVPDVEPSPLQSKGYECTLSYEGGLQCYFNGDEMTVKEWQTSMGFTGTKVDGAAGKTMNKALELNNLQKASQ